MILIVWYIGMLSACIAWGDDATPVAHVPVAQVCVSLLAQDPQQDERITTALSQPFLLEQVSFSSDVYLSAQEFSYLVELPEGSIISPQQLCKAVSYLFKKNKFEKIVIHLQPGRHGQLLHFELTGMLTLKKLKFHGVMIGKEKYRSYYLIEPGEQFTTEKHEQSIKKIVDVFRSEGYFNALVDSTITHSAQTKQVIVHCSLKKNDRFSIGGASLEIKSDQSMTEEDKVLLRSDLEKIFLKKVGRGWYSKEYLTEQVARLKKELAKKGYIYVTVDARETVKHEQKKVDLVFTLDVHHKKEFIFTGNTFFSRTQLLETILEFGHSAWLLPASMFAQEIKQLYEKHGFWSVEVSVQESADCYSFAIHEGPRISIQQVVIQDTQEQPIDPEAYACFADIVTSYYDAHKLHAALDTLSAWYRSQGYWDAAVIKVDYVPYQAPETEDATFHAYTLRLVVEQGARSYLTAMTIEGYKDLEEKGPFAYLAKSTQPIPFDTQILHMQRQWLLDHFRKQGYLHAEVKPEVERHNGTIAVTWHVKPGEEKTKFSKTVLVGSNTFPFEYVQRELAYKKGDIWNQDALKKSFARLKKLDLFEHIHFYPDQVTKEETEKDVMIKLQEDDRFEVRARAGLELLQFTRSFIFEGLTYRVGGTFLMRNPFNIGDKCILDADIAPGYRKALANYQVPWIFNKPIKTELILFSDQYLQPGFIGCTKNIYELTQYGMLLGLSRAYDACTIGINSGFEWMQTRIPDKSESMCALVDNIARAIDFNPLLLDRQVPYFRAEPTLVVDLLDQKMNPTHGAFSVFSLKCLAPLTKPNLNSYMLKALVEQSLFTSYKSLVFALRFRCGHIFFTQFNSIMPSERFYLGGANSVRSYDTDFAPPLGSFINEQGQKCYVPQGGKTMVNLNAEVRFPIYKRFGGVFFQDIGMLSANKFADFDPKNVLLGTGFGGRLATPLGSLRFDVAWKWRKQPGIIRPYAWFLTFGQAF